MEDVTDWAFRSLLSKIAPPDVYYTEFAHADRIALGKKDALDRLDFDRITQRPLVIQIWGTKPEQFRKAICYIRSLRPDGIDLNMGCPQDSITKKGAGAAHIKNRTLSAEIIQAAWEACLECHEGLPVVPLSIKTRTGWDRPCTESWISFLLGYAPAALTLHARTAVQQSEGTADWSQFGVVRNLCNELSPTTLVIGNGDIKSGSDALHAAGTYGLDGVMIGRGVFSNPLVFRQARRVFGKESGRSMAVADQDSGDFNSVQPAQRCRIALHHLDLYNSHWNGSHNFEIMKKFFKIYLVGDEGLLDLRSTLNTLHSPQEARDCIVSYLEKHDPL